MKSATTKQMIVLGEIINFAIQYNYPPTVRELCKILGLSPATTHGYLNRLRLRGFIDWEPERPRTLRILSREVGANAN
ncbi:LexA family protein [Cohnella abietis]|uniref:LexA repressor DNA-binding domain-containing protein n=1 Tax=Cohnella abietis TaxID=2507935 RepID=A0A3T1D1R6_9BACL|nr:hypothetical protein KCTCHS21_14610 [Cohnella abietis]